VSVDTFLFDMIPICMIVHLDNPTGNPRKMARPQWPSHAYPGLVGNVYPVLLSYSYHSFPEPAISLSLHWGKRTGISSFAETFLKDNTIRLNTEVIVVDVLELEARMGLWRLGMGSMTIRGLQEHVKQGLVNHAWPGEIRSESASDFMLFDGKAYVSLLA
jgi:hypothetical protein